MKHTPHILVRCSHSGPVPIGELKPHPKNPNQHSAKQVKALAKIIAKQGWRAPIVVSKRSGYIVAGHARLQAAELLGAEAVPVDFQDFESEETELAHLVADNAIPEMADMDEDALQAIIAELDAAGFDTELAGIVQEVRDNKSAEDMQLPAKSVFEVMVGCTSEAHQRQVFERLKGEGLTCRLLTL